MYCLGYVVKSSVKSAETRLWLMLWPVICREPFYMVSMHIADELLNERVYMGL